MANVKISELTAITSANDLAAADIIPLVDSSDSTTKRTALSVLCSYFGGGSSVWCTGTNTAYLLTDCVGIGTATPGADMMLRVQGDSCYTGDLKIGGDVCIGGDDLFMGTNTSGHMLIADGTNFNPVAMSGDVGIDSAGATTIQATSVENSMLAGSIANAKLSNSSVSYGGISLSLGGTDATPAFNLCDATAYKGDSALVTVGTIASGVWNGTAIANGYLANSSITLSDGSNTTAISLGGTMTFSGTSNEIEVAESGGTVTVGLPACVTGLTTVCATNFAGTLATAAQTNVTSLGTLTALTVDSICLNGTTIGHTSDTDLITLADGAVTIAGDLTISGDDLTMGTNTSGHILVADGTNYNPVAVSGDVTIDSSGTVTIAATSVENSMLAGSIANAKLSNSSVSYGGISLSLGGTDATPAFNLCDATAYKGDSALVTVGTVASGTWQGTAIATSYIAGTICDKTLASPVLCGTITGNAFLDEDNMASDSATKVASQQSIKAYVDSVASGLDLKCSSHAATTANLSAAYNNGTSGVGATLTNSGAQAALSVDGQTMASGERVLVKDQSTPAQNGIYTVTTVGDGSTNWVLTRATDFDSSTEITSGAFTFVETGSSYADSGWVMTTDGTITVGTTSLAWSQFSGAGQITAGDGMTKSGNTLNVGAGSNLLVNADAVAMCAIVTGLTTVCATNFAGTLATAAQANVTSVGTLTALTVDNICLDGATIGHTSDTDLITLADGSVTITGDLTIGVDNTGYDVKFFGATSGRYLLWDEANDRLKLRDNTKLVFGQSNDLEIYHDATDTIITNCTGKLKVLGDKFRFNNAADSESMLIADADAAVKLYYNGSVKTETTNTGMDVTGTVCSTNLNASSVYIGGTTSANELDNYVEGTFTPAYTAGSGTITLSTAEGYYTRIGNLIYVTIKMIASAISSPSGTLVISGLPVASANNTGGEGVGAVIHKNLVIQTSRTSPYVPFELTGGSADNIPITSVRAHAVVRVVANSTTAKLSYVDNDVSYTDAVASDIAADTEIHASFFYQA